MSRYGGWAPYVPVAQRRRQAAREMERLRKSGHPVAPVTVEGRRIASTFWGRAWCDNIEGYRDYENRLPRGRSYVRNGSVVDLQIAPGRISAIVSGSELYRVTITIKEAAQAHWRAICTDCAGGIDSLVELLQGRLSQGVMERLCRQQGGLFPRPSDIRFSCTCPDGAAMCKHVAAALYAVGARLDHAPDLLFRLRAVDETELLSGLDAAVPLSKTGPAAGRVLATDDMSALFGLDMAGAAPADPIAPPAKRTAAPKIATTAASVSTKPGTRRPAAPATTAKAAKTMPTPQPDAATPAKASAKPGAKPGAKSGAKAGVIPGANTATGKPSAETAIAGQRVAAPLPSAPASAKPARVNPKPVKWW
jgi:uncharacterized Zn finger protein